MSVQIIIRVLSPTLNLKFRSIRNCHSAVQLLIFYQERSLREVAGSSHVVSLSKTLKEDQWYGCTDTKRSFISDLELNISIHTKLSLGCTATFLLGAQPESAWHEIERLRVRATLCLWARHSRKSRNDMTENFWLGRNESNQTLLAWLWAHGPMGKRFQHSMILDTVRSEC